jgi:hypothetical protein
VFVTNLEAIQSEKLPLPLPDGKGFRFRFLNLIKELVQIMGKRELQVRMIFNDIVERLDHALDLEDQKSKDKVEACLSVEWLSGWLQRLSPLLMFDVNKPGRLKRRDFGEMMRKVRVRHSQMEKQNDDHSLNLGDCPLDLSGCAGLLGHHSNLGDGDQVAESGWLGSSDSLTQAKTMKNKRAKDVLASLNSAVDQAKLSLSDLKFKN